MIFCLYPAEGTNEQSYPRIFQEQRMVPVDRIIASYKLVNTKTRKDKRKHMRNNFKCGLPERAFNQICSIYAFSFELIYIYLFLVYASYKSPKVMCVMSPLTHK